MYQYSTVILMLVSMLSHTLLGCGWHHAHECHAGQQDSCQLISLCKHATKHAHHGHEHSAQDQHSEGKTEAPPVTPKSDPCQEGRCSYLASAPAKVLEEAPQMVDLLPGFDQLCTSGEKQYSHTMLQISCLSSFLTPGVRAQAQTTVWLL
ncbi:MAG: hypothetical protein QM501_01680 [Gimesia sp.]